MPLVGKGIKKGDWVEALSTNGSTIIGEAANDIYLGGTSHLMILLGDHGTSAVSINTNFWRIVQVIERPPVMDGDIGNAHKLHTL